MTSLVETRPEQKLPACSLDAPAHFSPVAPFACAQLTAIGTPADTSSWLSMLWRASRALRHLQPAKALFLPAPLVTTFPSYILGHPLHQSAGLQWSHALAPRAQPIATRDPTEGTGPDAQPENTSPALTSSPEPPPSASDEKAVTVPSRIRFSDPTLGPAIDKLVSKGRPVLLKRSSDPVVAFLTDPVQARKVAIRMADSSEPMRAIRVLIISNKLGCKFAQLLYEGLAHRFAKQGRWPLVRRVVELGKRHTGHTTLRLLNWRTRALVHTQAYASLSGVLELFAEEKVKPDRRTYHLLISGQLRNRDLVRAKRCMGLMEEAGFPPDVSTHALIVSSYRSLGSDPTVQRKALEHLAKADEKEATVILNGLIQMSLDCNDMVAAFRFLTMYDSRIAQSDSQVNEEGIVRVDGDIQRRSHPPPGSVQDTATYTMLVNYFAKTRDLDRACQVFEQMRKAGVRPDSRAAAALIRAHFNTGHSVTALRMVADVCKDTPQIRQLFARIGFSAEMEKDGLHIPPGIGPSAHIFNALLQGILTSHGLNGMRVVMHLMRLHNADMDQYTLEIFLSHLDKVENARPREIMRLLRKLHSEHITPTLRHLHVILRTILRRERRRVIRAEDRAPTDVVSFVSRANGDPPMKEISGVAESFDPSGGVELTPWLSYRRLMEPLVSSLQDRGVRSDRATFALRIRHDAVVKGDMGLAKQGFEAMVGRGLHPNEYHFSALVEGYVRQGDMTAAMDIIRAATKMGVNPNVHMYSMMIVGYAKQKNPTQALHIFHEMTAAGIQPDVVSVHILTRAFILAGAKNTAHNVLMELWPKVAPFPAALRDASLHILMKTFGALVKTGYTFKERLSSKKQRILRWKVRGLVQRWRRPGGE
ncbi:hypothetical protein POSPLADRAFT_1129916 [Postia placenta MAD-698-R-SB12]|uniref:PROP1-like PPR domain-containing protein n=1 Tax=Postia placenta MAD-698-R-SB12 TaxID=670580 RepID=A0A1X6NFI7_9APHY|nr:hypothetical protein POSPLADRAFT_1129916 [Postia placenta MAD-698-R-SB12]OSX67388.1 hypothetical protein POSPLADRAFT_1129916 [Postia placenta MAD-698-R-SB12]